MRKFCCDKFGFHYEGDSQKGLNIRVVGLMPALVNRLISDSNTRFFITEGYERGIDNCIKKIAINYCPFCGYNLSDMYNEEYIQEWVGL
jgi:hypothetical protein